MPHLVAQANRGDEAKVKGLVGTLVRHCRGGLRGGPRGAVYFASGFGHGVRTDRDGTGLPPDAAVDHAVVVVVGINRGFVAHQDRRARGAVAERQLARGDEHHVVIGCDEPGEGVVTAGNGGGRRDEFVWVQDAVVCHSRACAVIAVQRHLDACDALFVIIGHAVVVVSASASVEPHQVAKFVRNELEHKVNVQVGIAGGVGARTRQDVCARLVTRLLGGLVAQGEHNVVAAREPASLGVAVVVKVEQFRTSHRTGHGLVLHERIGVHSEGAV